MRQAPSEHRLDYLIPEGPGTSSSTAHSLLAILKLSFLAVAEPFGTWQSSPGTPPTRSSSSSSTHSFGLGEYHNYLLTLAGHFLTALSFGHFVIGAVIMQWGRCYMVCGHTICQNWIWEDKLRPGTKCRRCGTWWADIPSHTGKGKGYGRPARPTASKPAWPAARGSTWIDQVQTAQTHQSPARNHYRMSKSLNCMGFQTQENRVRQPPTIWRTVWVTHKTKTTRS